MNVDQIINQIILSKKVLDLFLMAGVIHVYKKKIDVIFNRIAIALNKYVIMHSNEDWI